MLDYFKRLKTFQIIGAIVVIGLLYGAVNLYTKIQFYKSFANQTRTTSVAVEEVKIDSINKIYPATSVIEAKKSYNVVSKTDGILNDIFFKESSFVELEKILKLLTINPSINVEIAGHTDSDGDEKDNFILSTNRAKSVVDWLLDRGVSIDRLTYKGYGENNPILENTNETNKAKNRRTELTIK